MNYETTTQKRQQTCFTTIIPVLAVRRPSVNRLAAVISSNSLGAQLVLKFWEQIEWALGDRAT